MQIVSPHALSQSQIDFITAKERIVMFSGGVRSGKTLAGAYALVLHTLSHINKPGVSLVCAHTYRMIKDFMLPAVLDLLETMCGSLKWEHYRGEHHKITIGKREIWYRSLENEGKIRGSEYDFIWWDEATVGVGEDLFRQLRQRLSGKNTQLMRITTNPGPTSHYLYEYMFKAPESKRSQRKIINAPTKTNIHLSEEYMEDIADAPDSWKARFLEGQWGVLEGQVYDNFDPARHIRVFELNPEWDYYIAIDFGYRNPFAALLIALDKDQNIYICDERYKTKTFVDQHGDWLKANWVDRYPVKGLVADPENAADRAKLEIILQKRIMKAVKKVKQGIEETGKRITHNRSDGTPRLWVHPDCANTIKEFESYEWHESPDGKQEKEEPRKWMDHAMDAFRYFVYTILRRLEHNAPKN